MMLAAHMSVLLAEPTCEAKDFDIFNDEDGLVFSS